MIIQFENGAAYRLSDITSAGDACFLYGLAQEYTPLGRLFVDSIWFNKPVVLIDPEKNQRAEAKVWRCHITGPVFARFLAEAKEKNADADYSAIWELRPGDWECIEAKDTEDLLSEAKEAETGSVVEYHLDHSYYRK